MTIETFDQRFKRLTSDMLMIDICRIVGIEIRQLMKVRSGVRVELSMNGLRKLCNEQGLDFPSFVRGYDEPWSSELTPSEVVTSDEPLALPARVAAAAAPSKSERPKFREDGSRIPAPLPPKRTAPVETVRSNAASAKAEIAKKNLQVSFRPGKPTPPPTIPEKYEQPVDEEFFDEDYIERPSIAARLRDAVSSAFRRGDAQSEQEELYSGVSPARIVTEPPIAKPVQVPTVSGATPAAAPAAGGSTSAASAVAVKAAPSVTGTTMPEKPSPSPNGLDKTQMREIQTLVSEVSSLRREINFLSSSVRELLER